MALATPLMNLDPYKSETVLGMSLETWNSGLLEGNLGTLPNLATLDPWNHCWVAKLGPGELLSHQDWEYQRQPEGCDQQQAFLMVGYHGWCSPIHIHFLM